MRRAIKEPSTWAALAAMLVGVGVEFGPVWPEVAVGCKAAAAVAGFVGVVMREGSGGA